VQSGWLFWDIREAPRSQDGCFAWAEWGNHFKPAPLRPAWPQPETLGPRGSIRPDSRKLF